MKKKNLLYCILLMQLLIALLLRSQTTFERTYGGIYYDSGNEVLESPNEGYIIIGTTRSVSNDTADAYVIRTDAAGDTLWTKIYGGDLWDSGIAICPASDDGYVLAIASDSFDPGNYDIYLVKINDTGDILWTKTYGGPETDYVHSLQATADGGYIILAHTLSFGEGSLDFYLVRVNQHGDTLWTKTYGGVESDWGSAVQHTADGGFILGGDTRSFGNGENDVYLIKTNTDGDTLWTRTYGGTEYDRAYHVIQASDNGYIIAATTESFGAQGQDCYLIKTNSAGDTLWTRVWGGPDGDRLIFVQPTSDGNYIATGYINTIGLGLSDVYLVKFNSDGIILWERYFGGIEHDIGYCVRETSDGGFIVVGRTESFNAGNVTDVYLVKTDASGNVTGIRDCKNEVNVKSFVLNQNYPNPFNSFTKFFFSLPEAGLTSLRIYDLLGREMETLVNRYMKAGKYSTIWEVKDLPSGIYVSRLKSGKFCDTKKMIYQK